jgi:hypothetical protein
MSEQAPSAPPASIKSGVLRDLLRRVSGGEFDLGKKDFHQFVVKEIYPLLGNGTLTVEDFERITQAFSKRADPYNKG